MARSPDLRRQLAEAKKKRGNLRHPTDDGGREQEHSAGEEKGKME
jgi:hypothetical protein